MFRANEKVCLLKVGDAVKTYLYPPEYNIPRIIIKIEKDRECGSGLRVFVNPPVSGYRDGIIQESGSAKALMLHGFIQHNM